MQKAKPGVAFSGFEGPMEICEVCLCDSEQVVKTIKDNFH